MLYKQEKSFTNLIVSKNDIVKLENVLNQAFAAGIQRLEEEQAKLAGGYVSSYIRVLTEIECDDMSSLQVEYTKNAPSPAVISDQPEFQDKKVNQINLSYTSNFRNCDIRMSLSEGKFRDALNVKVSSEDKDFLNLYFSKITEIVELIRKQDSFVVRHPGMIGTAFVIAGAQAYSYAIFGGLWIAVRVSTGNVAKLVTFNPLLFRFPTSDKSIWVWFWIVSLALAVNTYFNLVRSYIPSMYPSMEFDFVPEHRKESLRKRKIASWLLGAFLVPLFVGLIVNLLTD